MIHKESKEKLKDLELKIFTMFMVHDRAVYIMDMHLWKQIMETCTTNTNPMSTYKTH